MADFEETIIDSTKPNAGRIYDYFLGGHHNFEVDRKMGDEIMKQAPFGAKLARIIRLFMREGIKHALKQGFTQFLDLASGLPTDDHIHKTAPQGTKIIYSDIDPVTVQYGRKIIGVSPIVKYVSCNAATPEKLLEMDIVKDLFGANHKVAIGFNGICWFLSDTEIKHAMEVLYEWTDKSSIVFLSDGDMDTITDEFKDIINIYKNMNQFVGMRTKKELIELVKPWKVEEPGFLPVEEWINLNKDILEKTIQSWGGGGLYGGFLKK